MQRFGESSERDCREILLTYCSDGLSLESDSDVRRVSDRVESSLVILHPIMSGTTWSNSK